MKFCVLIATCLLFSRSIQQDVEMPGEGEEGETYMDNMDVFTGGDEEN